MKREMLKKISLWLALILVLAGTFAGGLYLGGRGQSPFSRPLAYSEDASAQPENQNSSINFNLYWEVWDNLKTQFVDKNKVSDQELFYGSLKGLAQSTGDPYTVFMNPKEAKEFTDDLA